MNLLTAQAARRFNAIPIGFHQSGRLLVAMADPSNVLALDDLKLMTGYEVRPVVASREDIASLIAKMNRLDEAVAEVVDAEDEDDVVVDIHGVGRRRPGRSSSSTRSSPRRWRTAPRTSTSSRTAATCACASASTACCRRPPRSRAA